VHDVIVARILKCDWVKKLGGSISKGARVAAGCNGVPHAATPEEERLEKEKTNRLGASLPTGEAGIIDLPKGGLSHKRKSRMHVGKVCVDEEVHDATNGDVQATLHLEKHDIFGREAAEVWPLDERKCREENVGPEDQPGIPSVRRRAVVDTVVIARTAAGKRALGANLNDCFTTSQLPLGVAGIQLPWKKTHRDVLCLRRSVHERRSWRQFVQGLPLIR
jgi:hypothetical protein